MNQHILDVSNTNYFRLRINENHHVLWISLKEISIKIGVSKHLIMLRAKEFELDVTSSVTSVNSRINEAVEQEFIQFILKENVRYPIVKIDNILTHKSRTIKEDFEIYKRIKIIELATELSDLETIELQVDKLLKVNIYNELETLLQDVFQNNYGLNGLLEENAHQNYSDFIIKIKKYMDSSGDNKTYSKKAVIDIYNKLDVLENKLDALEKEKATYIHTIHEFNKRYNLQLGNVIKEILYLKKEIALKSNNGSADLKHKEYNQYLKVLSELTKGKEVLNKKGLRIVRKKDITKINNVYTLQHRIKTLEKKIKDIKNDILVVKSDDVYLMLSSIANGDTYFTNLKKQLEVEKATLQKLFDNSLKIKETEFVETWIDKLWQWADKNNISSTQLSRKKENLISTKTIDFTGLRLDNIPDEICNLKDLTTLVLWDNNLVYLPEKIINFKHLKKLNLRGNPNLSVSISQKTWIDKLKLYNSVFIDNLSVITEKEYKSLIEFKNSDNLSIDENHLVELIIKWIVGEFKNSYKKDLTQFPKSYLRIKDEAKRVASELLSKGKTDINLAFLTGTDHFRKENITLDMFISTSSAEYSSVKTSKSIFGFKQDEKSHMIESSNEKILIENSFYSKKLYDIVVPTFERIRRVSMNYIDDEDNSDSANSNMYEYIDKYGKRDKALLYSSFDTILEGFIGKSISIIDWSSEQSIATTILLDYIREKQLNIKVENITLISDIKNKLSRGILHCNILKNNTEKIIGINKNLEALSDNEFNISNNSIVINLIYNTNLLNFTIGTNNQHNNYFIALSTTKDDNKINRFMQDYKERYRLKVMSNRNDKIGRFQRSEAIFSVINT